MIALESVNLFRNLAPGELQAVRAITREQRFAAGHEIFREGDPGDGVYFVKDGLVEISGVLTRTSGGSFPARPRRDFWRNGRHRASSPLRHRHRGRDTEVYYLPRGEMLSFIERSPALAFGLLQHISHRLREFNQLHLREVVQALNAGRHRHVRPLHRPRPEKSAEHHQPVGRRPSTCPKSSPKSAPRPSTASVSRSNASATWSATS